MGHGLGHRSNLITKVQSFTGDDKETAQRALSRYELYHEAVEGSLKANDMSAAVEHLNEYIDYAKSLEASNAKFNWRSDYAGSIFPEFLMIAVAIDVHRRGGKCLFSTKNSVVEMSLEGNGEWSIRNKNQDFSIGLISTELFLGKNNIQVLIPVVVVEVKTNIDINKLNGLDYSASRLKTTFPGCKYFLATETIDFSLEDNYITTSLDEIYCLRKQMRSKARKNKDPISHSVVSMLVNDIVNCLEIAAINSTHVYDRLESGKLIDGRS